MFVSILTLYYVQKDEDNEDKSEYHDPEESSTMMNQRIKLKETAYSLLGKAWPEHGEIQGEGTIPRTVYNAYKNQ